MSDFLQQHPRTHGCGDLRSTGAGKQIVLYGWVQGRRDLGGRIFVDVRDRSGLVQVVFGPDIDAATHRQADALRSEFCVGIVGTVALRTASGARPNPKIPTGEIEIEASTLHIFSTAETPPFPIEDELDTREDIRLKYRYLDLRRPALQANLQIRSKLYHAARSYFHGEGFWELETPFMGKYTPGGARNFLVPSRLNPNKFYALAESPQIYKQLFMVAGMERYFQIVRCFRDEDLRQDRQPEFTQIDVEMSFVSEEDIYRMGEGLIAQIWRETIGAITPAAFPRMPYEQAMEQYGIDKPDLRNPLLLHDITDLVAAHADRSVPLFRDTLASQGIIKLLRIPGDQAQGISGGEIKKWEEEVKKMGAQGLGSARLHPSEDGSQLDWVQSPLAKMVSPSLRSLIHQKIGAGAGDLLLFQFGRPKVANLILHTLRQRLGAKLGLIDSSAWKFLWVIDFPLFEKNEQGQLVAAHHPFTSPKAEHLDLLANDPGRVHARAYDLVLNGNEIGGGSIRIHRPDVQAQVFEALGLSPEECRTKFGFLLDAFRYGPPPHGGMALGLDRLAMLLCQADSLRDVIAFPKTQQGSDLMTDCPTEVSNKQLDELFLQTRPVSKISS